jgi:hypothetical protein
LKNGTIKIKSSLKQLNMKKNVICIAAIASAIILSAFTGKFATQTFKLTSDPTSSGIVDDPSHWSDNGFLFGVCTSTPENLACTIKFESTTMGLYSHTDVNGDVILNSFFYAIINFDPYNPTTSPRYLDISESFANPRYIISGIIPYKLQVMGSSVVSVVDGAVNVQKQQNLSAGVDVAYFNGKKI